MWLAHRMKEHGVTNARAQLTAVVHQFGPRVGRHVERIQPTERLVLIPLCFCGTAKQTTVQNP